MSKLDIRETQIAIKLVKDFFEKELSNKLNLIRVSAPLFVKADTGLNDNLTGIEKPVSFNMRRYNQRLEIVQSLAKWKRMALKRYDFKIGEGIYTDMDAIRPDEELSPIHSIYVDQWDWEKVISKEDRNEEYLKHTVRIIFDVFKKTEKMLNDAYPFLKNKLPDEITFITTQELEDTYPYSSPEEREKLIAKEHKAVFLMKIGDSLNSGIPHDNRAPDYDDWKLNGDILFWNPVLEDVIELSSMGIRVDKSSLKRQMKIAGRQKDMVLPYHKMLLDDKLPQTIGGGIGQSRICMFFLEKEHIGQVQASVWTEEMIKECEKNNIFLL
ncbi:MAG: aspartate--ammonia ligase [Tissierellia bacterium]|nr:aspartate--ammonia ligase [Tissierellia bacterium]